MSATVESRQDQRAALTLAVQGEALRLGFEAVGVAPVQPSEHAEFYRAWLAAQRHGSMGYLARADAVARRLDPQGAWPDLKSAVVVTERYSGGGEEDTADGSRAVIARYARGRDYHRVMKPRLLGLLRFIEDRVGRELPFARAYVDTGPVLERELARRAGLGWFGRNTMLLHPRRGSWFFLGSLLLEVELEPSTPFTKDHCGTCTACVTACPTGALLGRDEHGAPVIDATRCISYLTIENRGPIPRELRPLIGNRVFGCDICQEVCPFTQRFSQPTSEPAFAARAPGEAPFGVQLEPGASRSHPGTASPSLIALLETALDESAWDPFSRGSAIRRSGRAGFARNVCVGLGNWGSAEAVPVLSRALSDAEPLVRAHAVWALSVIRSPAAIAALRLRAAVETDPLVVEELERQRSDYDPSIR
ncbi:MAG TPA: tRNA epoxyqueuosine(34) reductase QueG [Longimicrobiales bacterium]|nr:tRNA epoxyqueuosine(34) reductase QueG [Longimicrobiales bacterium]